MGGTEDVRLTLNKVKLTTKLTTESNENQEHKTMILHVSGITHSSYLPKIKNILSTWKNINGAEIKINGISIIIVEENYAKLI